MTTPLMTTQIKGLKQLNWNIKKIENRIIIDAGVELTKKAAQTIGRAARKKCPVKTGNLKKSITVQRVKKRIPGKIIYLVGHKIGKKVKNDGGYGRLVEFGTMSHEIPKKDAILKRAKIAMRIGKNFVGGVVTHPGAKKTPYMRPAFDEYWKKGLEAGAKRAKKIIEKPISQG